MTPPPPPLKNPGYAPDKMTMESFRLLDEDNYEYEILRKLFFAYCPKIINPESFIVLPYFSREKFMPLVLLEKV